ncbi:MAG: serine/threonine-protein kinase [Chloroherpetonaceae bacterium]|nr:serine/threonine protein kinase [Chthonomonadaceae bacterium]MDW8208379.1 serine/threonine-protein kinase [Chloroherpetonaceae bacterium]
MIESMPLPAGSWLRDRYRVLRQIGGGAMAHVYLVEDCVDGQHYAIKAQPLRGPGTISRAETLLHIAHREAEILCRLSHPNLPRIIDFFQEDDCFYLVMEYVEGHNLKTLIEANHSGPFDASLVVDWGIQLCDVLAYLHGFDPPVIFRDIKPSNIIRRPDNTLVLVDFGIARQLRAGATSDTIVFGSPGYAPPEQYGHDQTEPRSDLYALGATLHHLLTGRDPATAPFQWPAVSTLNPAVPRVLDRLVMRCVEIEIARRPESAEAVGKSLRSIREMIQRGGTRDLILPGPDSTLTPGVPSSRLRSQDLQVTPEMGTLELLQPVILSENPVVSAQDPAPVPPEVWPARDATTCLTGMHPLRSRGFFRILQACAVIVALLCITYPFYQDRIVPEVPVPTALHVLSHSGGEGMLLPAALPVEPETLRIARRVEAYHRLTPVRYALVGAILVALAGGFWPLRRPTRAGMILVIGAVFGLICLTALTLLPWHTGLFVGIALLECLMLVPATVLATAPELPVAGRN